MGFGHVVVYQRILGIISGPEQVCVCLLAARDYRNVGLYAMGSDVERHIGGMRVIQQAKDGVLGVHERQCCETDCSKP